MKKVLFLLISVLAFIALVYATQNTDWDAFYRSIGSIPWWVWAVSVVGLSMSHWLRAGRLRAEWGSHLNLSWPNAWGLMVRHTAWVVVTPLRSGELIYIWALHQQGGVSIKDAALSLVKLRLQDAWVLGVLSLSLFLPISLVYRLIIAVSLFISVIILWPVIWRALHKLKFAVTSLNSSLQRPPEWQPASRGPRLVSWFFAISNWILKGLAVALPLTFLLPVGWEVALMAAAGGELAAVLPIQPPAGAGLYEAGVLAGAQFGSSVGGAPPWNEVVPAAIAVHMMGLFVTVGSAMIARMLGWGYSSLQSDHEA